MKGFNIDNSKVTFNGDRIRDGRRSHKFFIRWCRIISRCYDETHHAYEHYGARGIKVSEEFQSFWEYASYLETLPNYKKRKHVDRKDNDGNYERGNLRWATRGENNKNKGVYRTNKSGYVGVGWNKNANKWVSQIKIDCKNIYIGLYDTALLGAQARDNYIANNNLDRKKQTL